MYQVKDIKLAEKGELKAELARHNMPVLAMIREEFSKEEPLKDLQVGFCLHVTKETAILVETLIAGGAEVAITGCNPLSTQDDIAAYLASKGANVFAWKGETKEDYYRNLNKILDFGPDITVDDGCDLIFEIHTKRKGLLEKIIGGCEETTTGVMRLKAMEKDNQLNYPIIGVNNAKTKHLFDNRYGTGQSTIDGILRATSTLIAGKNFVVAGYGFCGKGIAKRARGMDANVIVTEIDAVKALEAKMDGFGVIPMYKAAEIGDIFVTATGNKRVIKKEDIGKMKSGAILANAGHFDAEIDIPGLEQITREKKMMRDNCEQYTLNNNKKIYLLAEGRLVNLVAAEGHPSEVMDMSFANQALCVEYLSKNKGKLEARVYDVPEEIDKKVAELKLKTFGVEIDELDREQKDYLNSWKEGT